jgi:hypothetical protein
LVTLIVAGPLLGWVLDRLILGRLGRATDSAKVTAVVGILIAVPALAKWIMGLLVNDAHFNIPTGDQVYLSPGVGPAPPKVWHPFAGLTITSDQVIVFGVAAVLAAALWLMLRRTRLGLQMRAATDRPELAQLMGVNRSVATGSAWITGTTLACIAGLVSADFQLPGPDQLHHGRLRGHRGGRRGRLPVHPAGFRRRAGPRRRAERGRRLRHLRGEHPGVQHRGAFPRAAGGRAAARAQPGTAGRIGR